MTTSFGLETELIICKSGKPLFMFNGQKTSTSLLDLLRQEYGEQILNYVKPELDSCQLEIINPVPHTSLYSAISEIQDILQKVLNITNRHGLHLPHVPYGKLCDNIIYADGPERYSLIHHRLLQYGKEVRNATNICGTHINIQTDDTLQLHVCISKTVADALNKKNFAFLMMEPVRYKKYATTVHHLADLLELGDHISPLGVSQENINASLLASDGRPYSSYELVRLKRLANGSYLSELRTIDGPTGSDPVQDFGKKTMDGFHRLIAPHLTFS